MIKSKRSKILIVDKKAKYDFLFHGFRKNKFSISVCNSVLKHTEKEVLNTQIFFVVLYDTRDVIQLIKLFDVAQTVIVASESKRILKSMQNISRFPLVDLSTKLKYSTGLQQSIAKILG
jgi:hypothetical protein